MSALHKRVPKTFGVPKDSSRARHTVTLLNVHQVAGIALHACLIRPYSGDIESGAGGFALGYTSFVWGVCVIPLGLIAVTGFSFTAAVRSSETFTSAVKKLLL